MKYKMVFHGYLLPISNKVSLSKMNIFNAVLNRGCENNNYIKNVTVTNNSNIITITITITIVVVGGGMVVVGGGMVVVLVWW